jgi:ABC-type taurine transport system ATPase subunit
VSQVLLQRAALGALRSADLQLEPGRYVVLATESEALQALIAILGGRDAPSSGRALLDSTAPSASPKARRAIAALFADEVLAPAPSVAGSVSLALQARGQAGLNATQLLGAAGLSDLAGLAPAALDHRATRGVALALALAHEQCSLLALHEPLATSLEAAHVLRELDRHTARGAIVLTTTTSSADALLLGGSWLSLELGRVRSDPAATPRLGEGPFQRVLVETADANALAQALRSSPLPLTLSASSPHQLEILGPALDVTVREVIALGRERGIAVTRVTATVAPVEALMAARAGFARGVYEAARAAAHGAPPMPAPGGFR